jgi:general stress protein 26
MSPFPAPEGFVIWFATSRYSAKVQQIRHDPKVSVYYADHAKGDGYVVIEGKAEILDDKKLLLQKKRDYWDGIPGWKELFVLIKVVPKKMEVVNYRHGVSNDPKTSKAPSIDF